MLDMELKIHKTLNATMEQHVEAVKAIKEEMVAVRQLQEKQGKFLVALEPVVRINLCQTPIWSIWIHP